jgi:hypothetical protein
VRPAKRLLTILTLTGRDGVSKPALAGGAACEIRLLLFHAAFHAANWTNCQQIAVKAALKHPPQLSRA